MKISTLLAAILFATSVFAQSRTVIVTELAAGSYSLSSPSGIQTVNVMPLGGGNYSFYSNGANATVMTVAPGMYTVTSSSGGTLGTAYIYSLGDGWYTFSNHATGETGTIQTFPAPQQQIPLPALSVRVPDNTNLVLLTAMVYQQCQNRGGIMYKAHWYSTPRCESPAYAHAQSNALMRKQQTKLNAKQDKERAK